MLPTVTIANPYVESASRLLGASPKNLDSASSLADELHEDIVEALLPRSADLSDALNYLADARDRLFAAIGAEQDAEEELAVQRKELRRLSRAAKRRTVHQLAETDEDGDEGEVDIDSYADEREEEQIESHALPAAAAKKAAAQAERVDAWAAAQDRLNQVLTALQAFEDR